MYYKEIPGNPQNKGTFLWDFVQNAGLRTFGHDGLVVAGCCLQINKDERRSALFVAPATVYVPHLECRPSLSLYTQRASLLGLARRGPSATADTNLLLK